ncbi:MAG: hypothetical protein KBT03_09405 [Bacteroidales bacterium]|nr:hypothetical protein [Candidatus Scybalousia scybalohippi]
MRIEIKNVGTKVVQNEVTQAEMERLEEKARLNGGNHSLSWKERSRLARIKKYGINAIAQNKFLHPEPEVPAGVPTFENPSGTMTVKEAEKKEEEAKEIKHRMVDEVDAEGNPRRYDEAGDPISFKTEEVTEKAFLRVIKEIKTGISPYQACINKRILPDEFFKMAKTSPHLQKELDEAREVYAESQVARLEKLSMQLEHNKIDTSTYTSVTNNIKWLVEKLFPTLYGNKTKVETSVTHNLEISQDKLRELNDLLRGNKPLEVEYQEVK